MQICCERKDISQLLERTRKLEITQRRKKKGREIIVDRPFSTHVVLDFQRVSLRSRFSNTLAFGGSIRSDLKFSRACKTDFGIRFCTYRWTLCRNNVQLPPAFPDRKRTRVRRLVDKIRSDFASILTERTWIDISDSAPGNSIASLSNSRVFSPLSESVKRD